MDRRAFIGSLACGWPLVPIAARAQTANQMRRIGDLNSGPPETPEQIRQRFDPLRALGWIEGHNLIVERRYANNKPELLRPLAEELVRLKVELILTDGTAAALAAKNATTSIPIVVSTVGDPVSTGAVAGLARPGGNVTGYSIVSLELDAKRLAVLRELAPAIKRVGVLENPMNSYFGFRRNEFEQACRSLGIEPVFVEVATARELTNAVAEVSRRGGQALLVSPDFLFYE